VKFDFTGGPGGLSRSPACSARPPARAAYPGDGRRLRPPGPLLLRLRPAVRRCPA